MKSFLRYGAAFGVLGFMVGAAVADPIRHPTAVFAGLDKTTGRIINFDVAIGESVQFGTLQVTPRVCNTRPQTETPQTTSFVEVDELIVKPNRDFKAERAAAATAKESKKIFSGWMFAGSPGLHGVEHPVYDVWLTDCKGGTTIIKEEVAAIPEAPRSGSQLRGSSPAPGTGLGSATPPRGGAAAPPPPAAPAPSANQLPSGSQLPPRPQATPQPTIVPSPLPPAQPAQQARPSQTQTLGGAPVPPANIGGAASAPTQLPGVRSPDIPIPPADVGRAQQRRAPSQTYFPTESNR